MGRGRGMAGHPQRRRRRLPAVPRDFPNRDVLRAALREYADCRTYWYVPKVRALNAENVQICARTLSIISNEFSDAIWSRETQDALLNRLTAESLLTPTKPGSTQADRTALVRITKDLYQTLGLLWIADDQTPIVTAAGLQLVNAHDKPPAASRIIARQISKLQYPNPAMAKEYRAGFDGLLPHLFLLEVLERTDHAITLDEYNLFVNLATSQDDVERICGYVRAWRSLSDSQREKLRGQFAAIPMATEEEPKPDASTRFLRIGRTSSYQRSLFCFSDYLQVDKADREIRCVNPKLARTILKDRQTSTKVTAFENREDWFAYFGDPEQEPSWFTYVAHQVMNAPTSEGAEVVVSEHEARLTGEQRREVRRLQIERDIEHSYATHPDLLHMLEPSLQFEDRQVKTPIGRMDLLCRGADGKYVVIEVKARPADDAVFGQILRYMGWIHRNYRDGEDNVRGIILANEFSDKAQYSRIGLMRDDVTEHLKFRRHAFAVEEG